MFAKQKSTTPPTTQTRISRRTLIQSGAIVAGTTVLGAGAGLLTQKPAGPTLTNAGGSKAAENGLFGQHTVPFYGTHQAGVITPAQAHALVLCFNVNDDLGRDGARRLLTVVTQDAAALTQGATALADTEPELGAHPANLTITVGVGAGFLTKAALTHAVPRWLEPLPPYRIDQLRNEWGQGDLVIQICGDDEVAVSHARRVLTRQIRSWARTAWVQRGFKGARGSTAPEQTMRNLMGQVDGTVNPSSTLASEAVWCGPEQGIWEHGTSMVVRRIAMNLDTWDNVDRVAREDSLGRTLATGAPLTGTHEHDEPDFEAKNSHGFAVIPPYSHIRRARSEDPKQVIFRRAYNYDDAPAPGETHNSGLVFIAFQADVHAQYVPLQQRLADLDALNEWTTPIGSAVFAVLPGCANGEYLGQRLIETA